MEGALRCLGLDRTVARAAHVLRTLGGTDTGGSCLDTSWALAWGMSTHLIVVPRVHVEAGGPGVMLPSSSTPRAMWDREPDKVRAFVARWDARLAEAAQAGIKGDFQVCSQFLQGLQAIKDTAFLTRVRSAGWELAAHEHGGAAPTATTAALLATLTGFAPSSVVGGFVWTELEGFPANAILTGGEAAPGHSTSAAYIGCWRPTSVAAPTTHNAAGTRIALGSGTGSLAKLISNESRTGDGLVGDLVRGKLTGPVTTCTVMLDGEDRPDGTVGLSTGDTWARILAGIKSALTEGRAQISTGTASSVVTSWLAAGGVSSVLAVASAKA